MIDFYDAHSHSLEQQKGGFLIALENEPLFENTLTNQEVINLQKTNNNLFAVEYVKKNFQETSTKIVKYHPRREKYSVGQIIDDIKTRSPKICIIDTLNSPFWLPSDYWKIAALFHNIQFIFPHAGGYDIIEFLKICNFQKNVWLDFSLTQEYFGWCGKREPLPYICDTIDYALNTDYTNNRILFGSDNPFYGQQIALKKYLKHKNSKKFLTENFERLIEGVNS